MTKRKASQQKDDEITDGQICPNCYEQFDNPRMLPCGQAFCNECVTKFQKGAIKGCFKCPSCDKSHKVKKEFPLCSVIRLINKASKRVSLGKNAQTLAQYLDQLESQTQETELNEPRLAIEKVQKYCSKLKSEVDLEAEARILDLRVLRDQFLKKIDSYEADCTKRIQSMPSFQESTCNLIKQTSSFCEKWRKYLNEHELDNDELSTAIQEAKKRTIQHEEHAKEILFGRKQLLFNEAASWTENDILGSLVYREQSNSLQNYLNFNPIDVAKIIQENNFTISSSLSSISVEVLNESKFLVVFIDIESRLCALVIDMAGNVLASSTTLATYRVISFKTCACDGLAYFSACEESHFKTEIIVVNDKLEVLNKEPLKVGNIDGICCDKSFLYCFSTSWPSHLKIEGYNRLLSCKQYSKCLEDFPFCILDVFKNSRVHDGHLFFIKFQFSFTRLYKICLKSGQIIFETHANDLNSFVVNKEGFTLLRNESKLQQVDHEMNILRERDLEDDDKRLIGGEGKHFWLFDTTAGILSSILFE